MFVSFVANLFHEFVGDLGSLVWPGGMRGAITIILNFLCDNGFLKNIVFNSNESSQTEATATSQRPVATIAATPRPDAVKKLFD